jgi:hypothetical protein
VESYYFRPSEPAADGVLAGLFAVQPIRELHCYLTELTHASALADWEGLRRVESLSLWQHREYGSLGEIEPLLRSLNFARLRSLQIGLHPVPVETAIRWLQLPIMARLARLSGAFLFAPAGEPLDELARGHFPELRDLVLVASGGHELAAALARLVRSETWKRLNQLTVHGQAGFPWAEALAGAPLRRLMVSSGGGEPSGLAAALTDTASSAHLEELRLVGNGFRGEVLWPILRSGALAELRRLTCQNANLTDDDLETLARIPALAHIERLDLWLDHEVGDRGVCSLFGSPYLESLTHLALHWGAVSQAAAAALAANEACRRLRVLSLDNANGAVLGALTQGEPFPELHTLGLGFWRSPPSPTALEVFLESPKLPRLCAVVFRVESSDANRFAEVFRRCPRIAWAGGEMYDGGDGVRVALTPENVYLPNHLEGFDWWQ